MLQKGFAPIILVIFLAAAALTGGGLYLYQKSFPLPPEVVDPNTDSENVVEVKISPSPKASVKSNSIPINITTTISTPGPTSFPTDGIAPPPASEVIINAAGSYTYSGQEIRYTISFPKNGGNVTGSVSGVCNGPIAGNFSGGDGGLIRSNVDAQCQLGILTQPLKADFEGKVYFSQGRADLEWQGSIPFYSGSKEFSLTFPPL